jgi:hypothetical protein
MRHLFRIYKPQIDYELPGYGIYATSLTQGDYVAPHAAIEFYLPKRNKASKEVSMRTCMLITFCLLLFACKRSGDKLDMSLFDKPTSPVAFAAQQCLPPTSAHCGSVCYDPDRYCCCTNPNTGSQCVIAKISAFAACDTVCKGSTQCQ